MTRIAFFSPYPADTSSFYRGAGVLRHLPGVQLTILQGEVNWATFTQFDLLWMQRPYLPEHLEIMKLAKQQIPVVVDYDDNLFEVPHSNPCYELYRGEEVRSVMRLMLTNADVAICSTQKLANYLEVQAYRPGNEIRPGYRVIPNAWNDYQFGSKQSNLQRKKTVFWRGSNTHQEDLLKFAPEICRVAKDNSEWTFVFQGMVPWMLKDCPLQWVASTNHWSYTKGLCETIRPSVMIDPLEDNPFNRAKSDLAWIEGTMAGAQVLCPDWMGHHGLTYYDKESFERNLRIIMLCPVAAEVKEVPMLSQVNRLRAELIQQVLK